MLYAIKADREIVYIGQIEEENWDLECRYHKRQMMEAEFNPDPEAPQDFYSLLVYWRDMEHKQICMQVLDLADEDEERAMATLICAIRPIGNNEYRQVEL